MRYKLLNRPPIINHDIVNRIDDSGAVSTFDPSDGGEMAHEYTEWLSIPGNTPDPADPAPPTPPLYKEKNSIINQLIAAGRMAGARAILAAPGMEDKKDLWDGAYKIAYDDQDVRALLRAVGMDDEDVMSKATTFGS